MHSKEVKAKVLEEIKNGWSTTKIHNHNRKVSKSCISNWKVHMTKEEPTDNPIRYDELVRLRRKIEEVGESLLSILDRLTKED